MKRLSPIEMMVDKACEFEPNKFYQEDEPLTTEEKAKLIAAEVVGHIDLFYPDMWKGVTKNARRSLRGTIINQVNLWFKK